MYRLKIILILVTLFFTGVCSQNSAIHPQKNDSDKQFDSDSIIFSSIVEQFGKNKLSDNRTLFLDLAKYFIGNEYQSKTLEINETEKLVVNLRGFDCTTYIETVVSLYLTLTSENQSFERFQHNLQNIRYRNGILNGYESRLHYFSEWIIDNTTKGILKEATFPGAKTYKKEINFITSNIELYPSLKLNQSGVQTITSAEQTISSSPFQYIPKEDLHLFDKFLKEGMIVGITTSIKGLDVSHAGIIVKKNNQLHLLHASSKSGKVEISEKTLENYLLGNKSQTGIIVCALFFANS
jgi:hypothetical protein